MFQRERLEYYERFQQCVVVLSLQLKRTEYWLFFFFSFSLKTKLKLSVRCLLPYAFHFPQHTFAIKSCSRSFRYFSLLHFTFIFYPLFHQFSTWCVLFFFYSPFLFPSLFSFFLFMYDRIFPFMLLALDPD